MTELTKPPARVSLEWTGGLAFTVRAGERTLVTDGNSNEGLSPVELMVASLAACMATDVVHILLKGRQPLRSLATRAVCDRAQTTPHRLVRAQLHFDVGGRIDPLQLKRAIALSRDKYCSVWNTMRDDIALEITHAFVEERA
jgi:putative redox protein